MSTVSTRLAILPDLPAVAALFDAYRQFYEQPADPALALQFIGDRMRNAESVILVAQAADATDSIVGFCQLYPGFCSVIAQPVYTLYDLYVAPDARQTGAGRSLMQAAHEHARQHGFARMDLRTARTNHAARALYESLGWVRDDVFFVYNKTASPAGSGQT
jgi:ribosomal protein S18 acetylase RimI-like enzyme